MNLEQNLERNLEQNLEREEFLRRPDAEGSSWAVIVQVEP